MSKIREFFRRNAFLVVIIVALLVGAGNYILNLEKEKKDKELIEVPVASLTLSGNTVISEDKLTTMTVSASYLPAGVITGEEKLAGMYVKSGCTIPAGGFFYRELISSESDTFGNVYTSLEKGESAYSIRLDDDVKQHIETGLIRTGQYIDIYYFEEYTGEDGYRGYLAGKLAENIRVLDVTEGNSAGDYIVLALEEKQIGDFILAGQAGNLVPIVSSSSNGLGMKTTKFYDVDALHEYLNSSGKVLVKSEKKSEKTEETAAEGQVE